MVTQRLTNVSKNEGCQGLHHSLLHMTQKQNMSKAKNHDKTMLTQTKRKTNRYPVRCSILLSVNERRSDSPRSQRDRYESNCSEYILRFCHRKLLQDRTQNKKYFMQKIESSSTNQLERLDKKLEKFWEYDSIGH